MRRSLLSLGLILICAGQALAVENCVAAQERPLQLMSAELKREFKALKKQKPPIYYMSYTYLDTQDIYLSVTDGGVTNQRNEGSSLLDVQVRVGSPELDNTRERIEGNTDFSSVNWTIPRVSGDGKAFTS